MKVSLDDLVKRFHIKKHEAGMFFLMLTMLPPGSAFDAINGRIEKIDDETLRLSIDKKIFESMSEDFIDESVSSYDEMFGHLPLE